MTASAADTARDDADTARLMTRDELIESVATKLQRIPGVSANIWRDYARAAVDEIYSVASPIWNDTSIASVHSEQERGTCRCVGSCMAQRYQRDLSDCREKPALTAADILWWASYVLGEQATVSPRPIYVHIARQVIEGLARTPNLERMVLRWKERS